MVDSKKEAFLVGYALNSSLVMLLGVDILSKQDDHLIRQSSPQTLITTHTMSATENPRGEIVIRMTYVVGALLLVAVALRLLARWKSKAGLGADDLWIVGSLIPSYGMLVSGALSKTVTQALICLFS